MKWAVTLLALCCLYVSFSQQQQHQFMARRYPLPYYFNSYYDDSHHQQLSRNNLMRQGPLFVVRNNYVHPPYSRGQSRPNPSFNDDQNPMLAQNQLDDDNDVDDYITSDDDFNFNLNAEAESQGRVPFRGLKKKVAADDKDARLFFLSSLSSYNLLSLFRTSTSTTFIFSTVTSTLTSATVITCAASSQFISTTACRRRRSVDEFAALQQGRVDDVAIKPAKVLPVEASEAPINPISVARDLRVSDHVVSPAEIESSQEMTNEENIDSHHNRQKRSFFNKYIVVTSSSIVTITSYSISASTVTKSITLGIGGCQACVSCLPSGVTIC